jgi:hypothetical protein
MRGLEVNEARRLCILFTRACSAIDVNTSIGGRGIARALQRLIDTRGKLTRLVTDSGLQYISLASDS